MALYTIVLFWEVYENELEAFIERHESTLQKLKDGKLGLLYRRTKTPTFAEWFADVEHSLACECESCEPPFKNYYRKVMK